MKRVRKCIFVNSRELRRGGEERRRREEKTKSYLKDPTLISDYVTRSPPPLRHESAITDKTEKEGGGRSRPVISLYIQMPTSNI